MSAAPAPTPQKALPKVLRIGVVRGGKVETERLIRHGDPVYIGENSRNTFVIGATGLAARHELFIPRGDSYILSAPDWMDGQLSWKDGKRRIEELKSRGEALKKGDHVHIPLDESVKGVLKVGDHTLLFQFVPAPPEPVRPINPADFRARLIDDEDPLFMSLLLVFTLIAGTFVFWVEITPTPERQDLEAVDVAADLVVERKIEQVVIQDPLQVTTPQKTDAPKPADAATKTADSPTKTPNDAPVTQESVVKKSALLQLIGSSGDVASGDVVNDILGDDNASVAKLDSALAGVSGVELASGKNIGMKGGSGGGREDAKVGVGIATGGTAQTGGGVATVVKKPKVDYGSADSDVESGDANTIPGIVRKNSGRVQSCVEQSLKVNPSMSGRVVIGFSIAGGKVTESQVVNNTTADDALGQCIARAVRGMRFGEDVTAHVEFPFVVSGQ